MSTRFPLLTIALGAALIAAPVFAAGPRGGQTGLSALDADEAATLTFMREEEKLARDVYLAMLGLYQADWGAVQFENIAESEQNHMDAMANALTKYGLPDPVGANVPGVFANLDLQQLHDELHDRGDDSYVDALLVGGLIEEVDIEDLDDAIAETDNADLDTSYGNLLRGSRNHLRAFAAAYQAATGKVYQAQVLDAASVQAIIDSPVERGGPR